MNVEHVMCTLAVGAACIGGFQTLADSERQALVGRTQSRAMAATGSVPAVGAVSQAGVVGSFVRNVERLGRDAGRFRAAMRSAAARARRARAAGDKDALTVAHIEMKTIAVEAAAKADQRDGMAFHQVIRANEMWGTTEPGLRFRASQLEVDAFDGFLEDLFGGDPSATASRDLFVEIHGPKVAEGADAFLREHRAGRVDAVRRLEFGAATDSKLSRLIQQKLGIPVRFTPSTDTVTDPVVARLRAMPDADGEKLVVAELVGSAAQARRLDDARLERLAALYNVFSQDLINRNIDLVVDLWAGAKGTDYGHDRVGKFITVGIDEPHIFETVARELDALD